MKTGAFLLTRSVGLLSDALESFVNLTGGIMALSMLTIAARPPDDDHSYGHDKAEYFSSGVEGGLILIAAASIGYTAVRRLIYPQPIEQVGIGLIVGAVATAVNFLAGRILVSAGRRYGSDALEADGLHLLTDVWTSLGVLGGVAAVVLTGLQWLDPLIALLVALNILRGGWRILRRAAAGLMDTALPEEDIKLVEEILASYRKGGVEYHALRTRRAGMRKFINVHVLVPGTWTVHDGHELLEDIEGKIRRRLENSVVFTHLESLEDERSWEDLKLDRDRAD